MRPRPMKATFTTNLRSSISSDRRVTVITYNRAANGPKNRPFAPPDVPQPRPGNLEIRNCGDHQVETCQIGCRSEEHTSELQSLMRNSYADFCLKHKNK